MPNHLPVTKTTLDNGLTVVLKEMHHAPVASFMIWYRVGSRRKYRALTGVSHWVEHMMFKGTPTFPGGQLDRMISREGGHLNAFTWLDFTAYYETMPSNRIDLALRTGGRPHDQHPHDAGGGGIRAHRHPVGAATCTKMTHAFC